MLCSLYQISEINLRGVRNKLLSELNGSVTSPYKRGHHEKSPHKIATDVFDVVSKHISQFPVNCKQLISYNNII